MNELDITFQGVGTLYAVVRRISDGKAWNGLTFVTFADVDVATYDVPLISKGGDYYAVDFPDDITRGDYRVIYYQQAGATPAITDTILDSEELRWNGVTASTRPGFGYEGRYTTEAEVGTFAAQYNIDVFSDGDDDGSPDDGALEQAIRAAESEIDAELGSPVESFTNDTAGESATDLLNQVGYKLATVNLAEKRGLTANQPNEFSKVREDALALLRRFAQSLYGVVLTDTDGGWEGEQPIAVLPNVNRDGQTINDAPPLGQYWDENAKCYRWQ